MSISLILLLVVTLVRLAIFAFVIYAAVQGVKALRKYNRSGEVRKEKAETRRSLGEVLKEHRVRCKMTQEFVAESLGVSRQAVSKWETGTADPSTSNLLALAKLFGVSAEELLRQGIRRCYYGHIHGPSCPMAYQGELNGTSFRLVSADWLMFRPFLVRNISI